MRQSNVIPPYLNSILDLPEGYQYAFDDKGGYISYINPTTKRISTTIITFNMKKTWTLRKWLNSEDFTRVMKQIENFRKKVEQ